MKLQKLKHLKYLSITTAPGSKIKYIVYRKTIEAILWKKYMKQLMQK